MLINPRSTASICAVLVFFIAAATGIFCGNAPFTCCKRAAIAMLAAYFTVAIAIKIINAIIFDAIVSKQTHKIIDKIRGTTGNNARAD